jgi:SAM-dependent methyltransferase
VEEQDYATTYALEGANWWFVGMRRLCLRWAGDASGRVLDVGCGTGINLEAFERFGPTVGVDVSSTALGFCRARGRRSLLQGDAVRLPVADASVGLLTAIGVVEHLEHDREAVADWARALEPGGRLVLLTSAYRWMWSGHDVSNHHVRRYRAREVRLLLEAAGLVDVRVSYANSLLFPPIAVVRLLDRARRRGRAPVAHKDTAEVAGPLDRLLLAVLDVERWLLDRVDLPFGVSIVATARRPEVSSGTRSG